MSVLRGGYYYSGGADYAIADAVAGLDHGVNRFLFGIRVRLVQDRVMLGGVEVLALFAELLDTELLEGLVNLGGDGLERPSPVFSPSAAAGAASAPSLEGAWAAESCAEPDSAEASAPEEA